MNIAQLERDHAAAVDKARTLIKSTTTACKAEGDRVMTEAERTAIQTALDAAKALDEPLQLARSDRDLLASIDSLAVVSRPSSSPLATTAAERRSIGTQFAESQEFRDFIRAGGHRRSGQWSSPPIDCALQLHGTTITEGSGSAGPLLVPQYLPGVIPLNQRRTVVADLAAPGTSTSNLITFMREKTFTNAAAAVAEGAAKPESALVFEAANQPVQKIAHWLPVSEEALEDVDQMRSIIDARLISGVELVEEDQLLNGSGVAPNLLGYLALPGLTPTYAKPAGESIADAMLKQMTTIATTTFIYPDGWVMNPADWLKVQISKNQQGNYLGTGPWAPPQTPTLWGLPGAVTPAIVAATALVGAFRTMSQIFRKGGIRIDATNSHQDYFIKNLVAVRGEERLALVVYRQAAFGTVTTLASLLAAEAGR